LPESATRAPDIAGLLRKGRRLRTVGVDDSPFRRGQSGGVLVVGAVCAGTALEGLVSTRVRLDGFDATAKVLRMVSGSKFWGQLHALLLNGVTLGGFNVVDLSALHDGLGIPVLAVMRRHPDVAAVDRALSQLGQPARRRAILARAGPIHPAGEIHFQVHGLEVDTGRALLQALTVQGHIPEPLRLAHLIGGGIVTGESGRRA
jgi:endonuclease V-like protein UPF0215 family